MRVLRVRNVCQAYAQGLSLLVREGVEEDSRAGRVLVMPEPVTTVYDHPDERVLFCARRDANPFFHLAEAIWMLFGCVDAEFLNNYVRDFGDRFAESNGEIHDAYGRRWRWALGFDQLRYIIGKLRDDPTSRQMVLQIWDATPGHSTQYGLSVQGEQDLTGSWKTRPCNTHVYFRVREEDSAPRTMSGFDPAVPGREVVHEMHYVTKSAYLDMMVSCRSNDVIWGAYGANAVHFSFLQEYVASMVGVQVGRMTQVSWNYHAYVGELVKRVGDGDPTGFNRLALRTEDIEDDRYYTLEGSYYSVSPTRLVDDAETFDEELQMVVGYTRGLHSDKSPPPIIGGGTYYDFVSKFNNRFLSETYWPAVTAMRLYRLGRKQDALAVANMIKAYDWNVACREWLLRRGIPETTQEAAE